MEPYFYCKYGGIGPICSDCKRNHANSPYKTCDITTWLSPNHIKTNGRGCTDYIPIKEPNMVNKQEFIEKACKWMKENIDLVAMDTVNARSGYHEIVMMNDFERKFREAMEE